MGVTNSIIALMLGVSLFIGFLALAAFVWALNNGQFDDEKKFTQGILFDGVDELNDKIKKDKK